jgi:hypothetical protein
LIEAIVASRRDAELKSLLAEGMEGREQFLADLLRVSQRDGRVDGEISPEVVARFLLIVSLGGKLLRLLQLPQLSPDDWKTFLVRLVDVFRADLNTPSPGADVGEPGRSQRRA